MPRTKLLTLLAALVLVANGCNRPNDGDTRPGNAEGGHSVLTRGNGGYPSTLDPALADDVHAFRVLTDIYEGLVAEGADGRIVAGVASSWRIDDDNRRYTFSLRPNARWSNGDPVIADDFVRALRRVASPGTASAYAFLLEPIENWSDVKAGAADLDALGVAAVDARTLELRLSMPAPHLLSLLSMPIALPRHPGITSDGSAITNGAYVLAERAPNGPIRLRRNPMYWDRDNVAIDEVVYLPITVPATELNLYRAGEIDITNTIPPMRMTELQRSMSGEVRVAPMLGLYYVAFDLVEPPFDDVRLRQALSMAIDREEIAKLIGRGENPAYAVVPPGVAGHLGTSFTWAELTADDRLRRARALYAEAGYGDDNPLQLRFSYDAGDIHERVALAVASMWQDSLGAVAELDRKEWKLFLDSRAERPAWDVMRFSWIGDFDDPTTFLEIFRSTSEQNLARYRNANYDALLDQAATRVDAAERGELLRRAEEILLADSPVAPLYFYVSKHLVKPHVLGFELNVRDRHPSKYMRIAPD